MTDPKGPDSKGPQIATRAELDHKKATRPKPEAGLHLSPPSVEAEALRRKVAQMHEARIKLLETKLKTASNQLNHDASKAMLKHRAKSDFDRNRE